MREIEYELRRVLGDHIQRKPWTIEVLDVYAQMVDCPECPLYSKCYKEKKTGNSKEECVAALKGELRGARSIRKKY